MRNNETKTKWWMIMYVPEGAFLFWALKGFKGKFDDIYIKYYYINFITSWIIRAIIFYFLFRDRGFTW